MTSSSAGRPYRVLGTPVDGVTYASALERIKELARSDRPAAVSACNTHLVTVARADETFHDVMQRFDLVAPDGYPLIWGLNAQGAGLQDRVYGPYLMRHTLQHTPAPWRHFFFGGTPECLQRLEAEAKSLQPDIQIAGSLSPPFRTWTEDDEHEFARIIRDSGADFVWVALGGERQERWIVRNLHRHSRGVFFAVGDAFELLAGNRPFAPAWMQRSGLTWLYRLGQEPRRLWARYFRFNSLFLFYTIRDRMLGAPRRYADPARLARPPHVAFLGSRGVPARYSGFEVVVEHLGTRLAERGYPVTVYNRYPRYDLPSKHYKGIRVVMLPTIPTKNLDTISHTALSALHALTRRYDVIYLCGVGNAIIGGFLRLLGYKVIINVDGADFNRAKWGSTARSWLRVSERWALRFGHKVIADNTEIVARYEREYGQTPLYLSYGAIIRETPVQMGELTHWNLTPRGYILFVSRLTPENQADLLLRAYANYRGPLKLVICGGANYEHAYFGSLREIADERVIFTGPRYGDSYLELSQNAAFYVMPADIEATRLVLLDQLGMGAAILYHDCAATREVVADAAEPFSADDPETSLTQKLTALSENPERCEELRRRALDRAKTTFHWDTVVDRYEELFEEIGVPVGKNGKDGKAEMLKN